MNDSIQSRFNMNTTTILKLRPWLAALALALACPQLRATDYHVATAQALQNALTLAANNGVNNNIYLTNGNFAGNFNYNSSGANNLTLLPEQGLTNTGITIDGAGVGSGLTISSSASTNTITVQGISFAMNVGNVNNSALLIGAGNRATILVSGCRFFSPPNSAGSGLSIVSGLNVAVIGCTMTGTPSGSGYSSPGSVGASTASSFTGNIIVENCFISSNYFGLSIQGNSVVVSNNIFAGNLSSGLYVMAKATLSASKNTFYYNGLNSTFTGAPSSGEGAVIWNTPTVTFTGNTFTTNGGSADDSMLGGGGLSLIGIGTVTLIGNTFMGNTAPANLDFDVVGGGGGVNVADNVNSMPPIYTTTLTITGNDFIGNKGGNRGGAILVDLAYATVTILANTLEQNTANGNGGALYVSAPAVTISDNLVAGNAQTNAASTGGGVWVDASANLVFINNTITTNISAGGGGGSAFQINGTVEVLNVFNNIFWGNSGTTGADVWLAGVGKKRVFSNNDAHDLFGIWDLFQNNLDADPQFVAPASGDYHLQKGSPCLDAGTTAAPSLPAVDLDGNPRTVGGTVDLGCYELSAPVPLILNLSLPSTGGVKLQWPSTAGATYIVQETTDLRQGFHNWTGALPATPPINTYSDTFQRSATTVFYRIIVQ